MLQMILTGLLCGALLGFVMQRGRFCLTGGFRDMYIAKDNRMFYALLIAIAVQSVGVYTLIELGIIQYSAGAFPWVSNYYWFIYFWDWNCTCWRLCNRNMVSCRRRFIR